MKIEKKKTFIQLWLGYQIVIKLIMKMDLVFFLLNLLIIKEQAYRIWISKQNNIIAMETEITKCEIELLKYSKQITLTMKWNNYKATS